MEKLVSSLTSVQIIILIAILGIVILGFVYIYFDNRAHKREMKRRAKAIRDIREKRRQKELA